MGALPHSFERYEPRVWPPDVPEAARFIVEHALETFGSEERALSWLSEPNQFTADQSPLEILRNQPDKYELVDHELYRIDYGVF